VDRYVTKCQRDMPPLFPALKLASRSCGHALFVSFTVIQRSQCRDHKILQAVSYCTRCHV